MALFKDLINAWLMINSTNVFFQLLGLPAVPVWFTKLTESLRKFLVRFHLAFLADWWAWLSNIFELIETLGARLFEDMQVTCEGSQMPLFVCLNFSLIFFAVILIESNFDLLLSITMKRYAGADREWLEDPLGWLRTTLLRLFFKHLGHSFETLGEHSLSPCPHWLTV